MKKKILGMMFLGILFFPIFSVSAQFSDVTEDTKYKAAIEYLQEKNIVKGDTLTLLETDQGPKNFRPYDTINRAEFLKIVLLASSYSSEEIENFSQKNCFPDINGDEWFAKYVCFAKEKNFVNGRGSASPEGGPSGFYPADEISFVEAAKIMVEVLGLEKISGEEDGAWYEGYVKALTETKKVPRTVTSFDYKVKRSDMAEIVWRVLEEESLREEDDWIGDIKKDWVSWKGIQLQIDHPEWFNEQSMQIKINLGSLEYLGESVIDHFLFEFWETDVSELEYLLSLGHSVHSRVLETKNFKILFMANSISGGFLSQFSVLKNKFSGKVYISNKPVWDAVIVDYDLFFSWNESPQNIKNFFVEFPLRISEKDSNKFRLEEGFDLGYSTLSVFGLYDLSTMNFQKTIGLGGQEIVQTSENIMYSQYEPQKNCTEESCFYECWRNKYFKECSNLMISVVSINKKTLMKNNHSFMERIGDLHNWMYLYTSNLSSPLLRFYKFIAS